MKHPKMAATNAEVVLYSYWRSSCSWRVRTALALKGLLKDNCEIIAVNLLDDEQKTEGYGEVNPMHQVPSLAVEDGTKVLTQSVAIMEYIEEAFPEPALLPKDMWKRAQVREIVNLIASGIQPLQNLSVLRKLPEGHRKEWGEFHIRKGFIALEAILKKTSGKYCVDDDISLADVCLVPQVFNASRFQLDMTDFPTISDIYCRLIQHPAFEEAKPENQPDVPK
ncbi:unnamed protein product [Cyprideis torosa]|uniref:maleylacetoacetate isomerase n=1 Tax=Cyprideis torosa TaxID=163714 RepID=A0A7R8ZLA3_9CRUS|nr:unnamed protein product [Cyprideis torosa]CAG0883196.1 unnamed protein product [Cyprideis torosa]